MKKITTTTIVISLLSGLTINTKPAFAGCGFLDITCSPSDWTEPIGGSRVRNADSGSCIQSIVFSVSRKFYITNASQSPISFSVSNQHKTYLNSIQPNQRLLVEHLVRSGANNNCENTTFYGNPVVTFDSDLAPGVSVQGV